MFDCDSCVLSDSTLTCNDIYDNLKCLRNYHCFDRDIYKLCLNLDCNHCDVTDSHPVIFLSVIWVCWIIVGSCIFVLICCKISNHRKKYFNIL